MNAKQKDREVYREAQIIMSRATIEQYDIDETLTTVAVDNYPESVATTARSDSGEPFAITCDVNGVDLLKSPTIESMSGKSFDDNISVPEDSVSHQDEAVRYGDELDLSPVKRSYKTERIDQKFERLSSQLLESDDVADSAGLTDEFEQAMIGSAILNSDEVNNCQSDFSKISWDDSVSVTTAGDAALGTPDNDIQELPKGE